MRLLKNIIPPCFRNGRKHDCIHLIDNQRAHLLGLRIRAARRMERDHIKALRGGGIQNAF